MRSESHYLADFISWKESFVFHSLTHAQCSTASHRAPQSHSRYFKHWQPAPGVSAGTQESTEGHHGEMLIATATALPLPPTARGSAPHSAWICGFSLDHHPRRRILLPWTYFERRDSRDQAKDSGTAPEHQVHVVCLFDCLFNTAEGNAGENTH